MAARSFLLPLLVVLVSAGPNYTCRYIPGDAGWPTQSEWARLNLTVGGRLLATVPVAHVCHQSGLLAAYNRTACEDLGKAFQDGGAETLCPVPGEIFNPYWQNDSCSPFTPPGMPCELGNRAVYSINVSGPADVQAGLTFATQKNVRLVIRNTGIDYLGKSTGRGALALWTYNLKTRQIIANYSSPSYSGPAIKLGAGVTAGEAYEAVRKAGYRIVAPECGLTGVTGGYVQSGGQSQLVTAYGLAADQVLEWEVITPEGEYLIATPQANTDLYWALAGGGGGTYGVVLSATSRAFAEGPVTNGQLVAQTTNTTALWEAIGLWYREGPSYVNHTRNNIQFFVTNESLTVFAFLLPDPHLSPSIPSLLRSFLPALDRLHIPYNLTTTHYPSYMDSFLASYGPLPYGSLCPSFPLISSRLIPASTLLNPASHTHLMRTFRNITATGTWWIGCSFLNVDDHDSPPTTNLTPSIRTPHPPNSVPPAWRAAAAYCNPQTHTPYPWTNPALESQLRQQLVTEIFPAIERATPGGGVLPELDPTYGGDWREALYGANYDRLLRIKRERDPARVLWGRFAVGSEDGWVDGGGRLCLGGGG